jgi:hypothetical protein
MTLELKIPGINILTKYNYTLISNNDLKAVIETSGNISHFDRQQLFGMGWKHAFEVKNRYTFDMLLCK